MTRHVAPRATPDRTCAACGHLKAAERFPRGAGGRRLTVCETCAAKATAPLPCARCGESTPRDAFPTLPSGRPSKYCGPCKEAGLPDRACTRCGVSRPAAAYHRYPNGQRSRSCEGCRMSHDRPTTCLRCKRQLQSDAYHRYPSGSLATSCNDCRRVRPRGPKGPVTSPNPCTVCGGPIQFGKPPSHLAARKPCSRACYLKGRRSQARTCLRCKRRRPFDAFDKKDNSNTRRSSCRDCTQDATDDRRPDLALRPSVQQMAYTTRRAAQLQGVPHTLRASDVRALHAGPCALCGAAVSGVVLTKPDEGYTRANSLGVCRMCRRLLRLAPMAEIVLHANEVAAYSPLDPDRPEGCARCRCTRSKASVSCEPGLAPDEG